jgi:hypothetical protein
LRIPLKEEIGGERAPKDGEERVTLLITLISKISLGDFLMRSFYLFFFDFSKGSTRECG